MNSNANDWIEHASFGLARVSEDRGNRLRRRIHHLRGEDDSKGRAVAESLKIAPSYKPEPYHHAHFKRIATSYSRRGRR